MLLFYTCISQTMIKERDIANLNTLSGKQLGEFCRYWNTGPGRDAEKENSKVTKLDSEPDYQKGFYKIFRLSN